MYQKIANFAFFDTFAIFYGQFRYFSSYVIWRTTVPNLVSFHTLFRKDPGGITILLAFGSPPDIEKCARS